MKDNVNRQDLVHQGDDVSAEETGKNIRLEHKDMTIFLETQLYAFYYSTSPKCWEPNISELHEPDTPALSFYVSIGLLKFQKSSQF